MTETNKENRMLKLADPLPNEAPTRLHGFCSSCCVTFHAMSDHPAIVKTVFPSRVFPENYVEDQVARRLATREEAERRVKAWAVESTMYTMTPCPSKEPDGSPCIEGQVRFIPGRPGPTGWDNPNAFSMDRGWRPAPAERPRPVYLGVPEPA